MNVEVSTHQAHRDLLAKMFQQRPFICIDAQECRDLVGENYMQRISEARRQLRMNIECVPQYAMIDGHNKRISGAYRFRPNALGRDAADLVAYKPQPLFDTPSGWQR